MVPEQDEFLMATIDKFKGGPNTRISETAGIGLLKYQTPQLPPEPVDVISVRLSPEHMQFGLHWNQN